MDYEGPVSLWLGRADSKRAFDEFLRFTRDEDGEMIASAFMKAFDIESYEEDFQEAFTVRASRSLAGLLKGCSYTDQVIPQYTALLGESLASPMNAVVLLYDFRYEGKIQRAKGSGVELTFQGLGRFVHRPCP